MTEKKTVALLCGGRSSEHPISLITAAGVLGAIDRTAYEVITIGITRDGRWYLTDEQELAELTAGTRGTAEFPEGTQQVFLPMVWKRRGFPADGCRRFPPDPGGC